MDKILERCKQEHRCIIRRGEIINEDNEKLFDYTRGLGTI